MDTASNDHPGDHDLRAYGLGKLEGAAAAAVAAHLEVCAHCRMRVVEMPDDTFLDRLRDAQVRPESPVPGTPSLVELSMLSGGWRAPATPLPSSVPPGLAEHTDYELLSELGRGGMGVVYLARNTLMDRKEVLKVVSRELMDRRGVLDRFLREIRNAAQLHHPNIVTAYSAIRAGESIVFAMEFVEGFDLAQLVKGKGPLPVAHACNFIYQAALGLQYAHERGMVHRDIKPSNLILARQGNRPVVKVLDFGLAKATREGPVDKSLTHEGQMLGTPDYIAPEQSLDATRADIRADIYSLGCTLYYLLTGGPPFRGGSVYEVLQAHHSMEAKPLNLVRPDVPWELAAVVDKMMAKDPERRYQTPKEVAQALKPFFKTEAVSADAKRELSRSQPPVSDREQAKTTSLLAAAGERDPQEAQHRIPRMRPSGKPSRRSVAIAASVFGGTMLLLIGYVKLTRMRLESPPSITTKQVRPPSPLVPDPPHPIGESNGALSSEKPSIAPPKQEAVKPVEKPTAIKIADAPQKAPAVDPKRSVPEPPLPIVRLKPSDPEASDRLRRQDIPDYELLAAGQGDRSKAPAGLVAVIGDSRLNDWNWVQSMAFSGDGRTLVTGSIGGHVTIWNVSDGRRKLSLDINEAGLEQNYPPTWALNPDGRTLVTAVRPVKLDGEKRVVQNTVYRLWDTTRGRALSTLGLGRNASATLQIMATLSMAFSPDGRFLAAGGLEFAVDNKRKRNMAGMQAAVLVWDLNARQAAPRVCRARRGGAWSGQVDVSFDRDSKTIFALSHNTTEPRYALNAWNIRSGEEIPLPIRMTSSAALGSSFWGRGGGGGGMRRDSLALVYFEKGAPAKGDPVKPPADAPDQLVIFDLTTRQERSRLDIAPELAQAYVCGMSPDGSDLCLSVFAEQESAPHGLLFWNVATNEKNWPRQGQRMWGSKGIYSPDGNTIALATTGVRIWDVAGQKERLPRGRFHGRVEEVCFNPDGASLAIALEDGVMIWDIASHREIRVFEECSVPISFSPDGRRMAARHKKQIVLYDLTAKSDNLTLADWSSSSAWNDSVHKLAFSPDGRSIALGYGNGTVEVVDTSTGKAIQQYPGIASNVTSIAFSPDGRLLAASGEDAEATPVSQQILEPIKSLLDANQEPTLKVIKVWNVATRQVFRVIHGPDGPVAFSGDNRLLATGPVDARYKSRRPVPLWHVELAKINSIVENGGANQGFGPDGVTIATSGGGNVRMWDASTRNERQVIPLCDPDGQINHVAFSPTGRYIATANGNGTVYIVKIRWP